MYRMTRILTRGYRVRSVVKHASLKDEFQVSIDDNVLSEVCLTGAKFFAAPSS